MNNTIHYLNTDLDLTSPEDLTGLAAVFESRGIFALHVTHCEDGRWIATFETDEQHTEPETNIAAIINVVESLDEPHRATWFGCTRRELNIGYDCGAEPWEFNQGLSSSLLGRIAAVGGSLRLTLYPDREPANSRQPLPQPDESGPLPP
jgi:hypothetical protein